MLLSIQAVVSRALRHSAAASCEISRREPTAISRGPRPKFLILKYMDCEMRCALQNSAIVKAAGSGTLRPVT